MRSYLLALCLFFFFKFLCYALVNFTNYRISRLPKLTRSRWKSYKTIDLDQKKVLTNLLKYLQHVQSTREALCAPGPLLFTMPRKIDNRPSGLEGNTLSLLHCVPCHMKTRAPPAMNVSRNESKRGI